MRKPGEWCQSSCCEKWVKAGLPELEEMQKLGAVSGPWVEIECVGDRLRDAKVQGGGPAIRGRKKRIADGREGALLAGTQSHGQEAV